MKLPPLSNRLLACCNFVPAGARVADIGCDHGYVGIYLLKSGVAQSVIAADLREGPLQSAVQNAEKYGLQDRIRFYLSDGVQDIPREFDTLICAGMGADTIKSILDAGPWLKSPQYRLILQCQSRRPDLRRYLYEQGYCIVRETLAQDSHFIYPVMEVVYRPSPPLTPAQYHITPALLKSNSPLLPQFYDMVISGLRATIAGICRSGNDHAEPYKTTLSQLEEMEEQVYGTHS